MNSRDKILVAVNKTHRHLISEYLFRMVQTGILLSILTMVIFHVVSRLFVFPHYQLWAIASAVLIFLIYFVLIIWKRPKFKDSISLFDHYFPENLLVTSLNSFKQDSILLTALRNRTLKLVNPAFDLFKLRKKNLWRKKSLIGILIASIFLVILLTFPSETQLVAKDIEV